MCSYVVANCLTLIHLIPYTIYIVEKFAGENVWQIYSFQVFGGKMFGE